MLPRVIIIPSCSLKRESQLRNFNFFKIIRKNQTLSVLLPGLLPGPSCSPCWQTSFQKIKLNMCFWVTVNKLPPRSAEGLDGARCPGAVDVIPAGTSGCYNPPDRAATSCASAAGPEVCWSGCSVRCCSPTRRGRAESYRPWSRWRWGCDPGGPRRFCTASWT